MGVGDVAHVAHHVLNIGAAADVIDGEVAVDGVDQIERRLRVAVHRCAVDPGGAADGLAGLGVLVGRTIAERAVVSVMHPVHGVVAEVARHRPGPRCATDLVVVGVSAAVAIRHFGGYWVVTDDEHIGDASACVVGLPSGLVAERSGYGAAIGAIPGITDAVGVLFDRFREVRGEVIRERFRLAVFDRDLNAPVGDRLILVVGDGFELEAAVGVTFIGLLPDVVDRRHADAAGLG